MICQGIQNLIMYKQNFSLFSGMIICSQIILFFKSSRYFFFHYRRITFSRLSLKMIYISQNNTFSNLSCFFLTLSILFVYVCECVCVCVHVCVCVWQEWGGACGLCPKSRVQRAYLVFQGLSGWQALVILYLWFQFQTQSMIAI